jgi:hypothetical protein
MQKDYFGISESTLALVKELWRKPTLLEQWAGDVRILGILREIRKAREPGTIGDLLGLGLNRDDLLRAEARSIIRELVALLPLEALPTLDQIIRRAWVRLDHWDRLRPKDVSDLQPATADDWVFVCLIASHQSGYVRAEAIRILRHDPSIDSLPFILLRLVDWVDEVRSFAESQVRERLRPEYADSFVQCLALLTRLGLSTRLRPACREEVVHLLCSTTCAGAVARGFESKSHVNRRECFRLAVANPGLSPAEVIEKAATDEDVLVRKWVFLYVATVARLNWPRLREFAFADPYAPIRRIAFESLEAEHDVPAARFVPFLLDRSAAIRRSCQSLVQTRFSLSPAELYRKAIEAVSAATIDICVLGLAETGNGTDAITIASFISSASARTRCAVIHCLRALKKDREINLLTLLWSDVPSVAREVITSLFARGSMPIDVIWKESLKNPDSRVWLAVLKLVLKAGKWAQLRVYLDAVNLGDSRISPYAVGQLQHWVDRYNKSFAQPADSDRMILVESFENVRGELPSALSRELDFLIQTVLR